MQEKALWDMAYAALFIIGWCGWGIAFLISIRHRKDKERIKVLLKAKTLIEHELELRQVQLQNSNNQLEQALTVERGLSESLRTSQAQLALALKVMEQMAHTDALTGLLHRRYIIDVLVKTIITAGVAILDIDHFKEVNDTYGHPVGDDVLRAVAAILLEICHKVGCVVVRYGGEEFVLIWADHDLAQMVELAERIRTAIEEKEIHVAGYILEKTASIGVAFKAAGDSLIDKIATADGGLYAAKHGGRNQVRIAEALSLGSTNSAPMPLPE